MHSMCPATACARVLFLLQWIAKDLIFDPDPILSPKGQFRGFDQGVGTLVSLGRACTFEHETQTCLNTALRAPARRALPSTATPA